MRFATVLGCVMGLGACATAWAGCGGGNETFAPVDKGDSGAHWWAADPTCAIDSAEVHGLTPDGRVNVTAAEAWPSRPMEPTPPTAAEILSACAILSSCFSQIGDAGVSSDADQIKGITSCLDPTTHKFEERAIPEAEQSERWSFKVRNIIAKKGCGGVLIGSKRPHEAYCEESGCWWTGSSPATVTCEGTIATYNAPTPVGTRDCAGSYATCSTTSPTGCTDRPRVACQSAGKDRCDGDIKLGCDRCGLVSFHDCGLQGGHCVESPDGAACVYPDPAACTAAPSCSGSMLTFCSRGAPTTVDCVALGLAGCSNGHCTKQ
jgi:hypothetical protein